MKRWFALIVALQALFIVGEWGKYTVQAATGQKVVLKVVPVDPRSLFMGNYMALAFDISTIDPRRYGMNLGASEDLYGKPVYVGLEPRTPYARVASVTWQKPSPRRAGVVYLRGRIVNYEMTRPKSRNERQLVNNIRVDYGISRYYFPESRQEELLRRTAWRAGKPADITATVSVAEGGQAYLRSLTVDGQKVAF